MQFVIKKCAQFRFTSFLVQMERGKLYPTLFFICASLMCVPHSSSAKSLRRDGKYVNHPECFSFNFVSASLTPELLNANKIQNWSDVIHSETCDHCNIEVSLNLFRWVAEICFYFHKLRNEGVCAPANGGKLIAFILFWK